VRALALLLLATTVSAADLKIDPIAPDAMSSIRFTTYSDGCGTVTPEAHLEGSTIVVDAHFVPAGSCIPEMPGNGFTVAIGPLPSGVYEVETRGTHQPVRQLLLVRPVLPWLIPGAVPTTGGEVRINEDERTQVYDATTVISFDGMRGTITPFGTIVVPPHAPGSVDVAITTHGVTRIIRAGMTYFDLAAPPDPQIFEPLLFPVAYNGPGAFGTKWVTTNQVVGGPTLRVPLCGPCPTDTDGLFDVSTQSPAGVFVYGIRGTGRLTGLSTVQEVTRHTQGFGTPIPVVHESDFRDGWSIRGVPTAPKYRVTLRVWTLDRPLTMRVFYGTSFYFTDVFEIRTSDDDPHYAFVDLTERFKRVPTSIVSIGASVGGFERMWAMVSITDNETQDVTILTPP
jgi:hypothetical protein